MNDQVFATIKAYYERTISIDDAEGNVVQLPLRIRRFTKDQLLNFSSGLKRSRNRAADRYLSRKPDGDEQEKEPITIGAITHQVFRVPDDEIRRRRLVEMSAEEREKVEALDAEDEAFIAAFCSKAITDYVSVKPGIRLMFETADGSQRQLSTGTDLVEVFAGNAAVQRAIIEAIEQENTLSAEEKKRWRLRSASSTSSSAPTQTAIGGAPGATAAPVNGKDSAVSAAATDSLGPIQSGSTAM